MGNEIWTNSCVSITPEYVSQEARFNVTAIDPGYSGPANPNSSVEIVVEIVDINDNPPEFEPSEKDVYIEQNDLIGLPVSKRILIERIMIYSIQFKLFVFNQTIHTFWIVYIMKQKNMKKHEDEETLKSSVCEASSLLQTTWVQHTKQTHCKQFQKQHIYTSKDNRSLSINYIQRDLKYTKQRIHKGLWKLQIRPHILKENWNAKMSSFSFKFVNGHLISALFIQFRRISFKFVPPKISLHIVEIDFVCVQPISNVCSNSSTEIEKDRLCSSTNLN